AQARIVHKYIAGYFRANPILQQLVVGDVDGEILELNNETEVIVATNSYRSIRGKTYLLGILDECCYWRDENSANPDVETFEALLSGFAMLYDHGAMVVGISTPYLRSGLAYQKWEKHFGKDDDDTLVIHGPSTAFNPTIPEKVISAALARDPIRARSEWLAEMARRRVRVPVSRPHQVRRRRRRDSPSTRSPSLFWVCRRCGWRGLRLIHRRHHPSPLHEHHPRRGL